MEPVLHEGVEALQFFPVMDMAAIREQLVPGLGKVPGKLEALLGGHETVHATGSHQSRHLDSPESFGGVVHATGGELELERLCRNGQRVVLLSSQLVDVLVEPAGRPHERLKMRCE